MQRATTAIRKRAVRLSGANGAVIAHLDAVGLVPADGVIPFDFADPVGPCMGAERRRTASSPDRPRADDRGGGTSRETR